MPTRHADERGFDSGECSSSGSARRSQAAVPTALDARISPRRPSRWQPWSAPNLATEAQTRNATTLDIGSGHPFIGGISPAITVGPDDAMVTTSRQNALARTSGRMLFTPP